MSVPPASAARAAAPGRVVAIRPRAGRHARCHERITLVRLAERIAALLPGRYVGECGGPLTGTVFLLPEDTLLASEATALGVHGADDLYGGVVPRAFIATKVISHPALRPEAPVPAGWSHALAARLGDTVLPGYAVFDPDAARRACRKLLAAGPVRIKPARGIGGSGQLPVRHADELDAAIAGLALDELLAHGASVEQHLDEVVTYSIGEAELAGLRIGYCGVQRQTRNRHGDAVYGGTQLRVLRGGFDALIAAGNDPHERGAIRQARDFDAAVIAAFPGVFASRRNYDVLLGRDREGRLRSGVLEQSWRLGGATPAELAAFEAFAADPALAEVHASSHEIHALVDPPADATVYFRGIDPVVGALTKYSRRQAHGHRAGDD